MESKFRPSAYWILVFSVAFISVFLVLVSGSLVQSDLLVLCTLDFVLFYMVLWFVFGELRTKAIKVKLDGAYITKRGYLGFGPVKRYVIHEFDGFKIATVHSRSGEYEYFYLMRAHKKEVKISAFYHHNYHDLKRGILSKKPKFLGLEHPTVVSDVKEIFI